MVVLEQRQQARDTAPSRANLRQITPNLITMHPAEMEEIVLQPFSLGASRVQAYGCYGLFLGYRAKQNQFQEYDHYVRIDVDISAQFGWKFVYFLMQFNVPLVVLTVSGAGAV